MLTELVVSDLGVIEHLALVVPPGCTALTGETGAGKTLLVGAIELLLGGRADPSMVRPGAEEARVDGRFVVGDEELVLTRVVPRSGRSRAYRDGRPVSVTALAEAGAGLVDLHGQHAHQTLLATAAQRAALDAFGHVDLTPLRSARAELADVDARLGAVGGDARSRARELDLLRFQVDEISGLGITGPDEDERLAAEEDELAGALALQEAGARALDALSGDGGARDTLSAALGVVSGHRAFEAEAGRLRAVAEDLADATAELRRRVEGIEDDPARLAAVRSRRQALRGALRKYGDDVAAVLAYLEEARSRLAELEGHDALVAALERERTEVAARVASAAAEVRRQREAAAQPFGKQLEAHLRELAMPRARVDVRVGGSLPGDAGQTASDDGGTDGGPVDDGSAVDILLAANPGGPLLPLRKVASGGELARAMLALRLTLTGQVDADRDGTGPATLVFDEVDAGIGGSAALAVGAALAALSGERQVLVVTHLAQVAAFADTQVAVEKHEDGAGTRTTARTLDRAGRVVELARMLSGKPDSTTARRHAAELLASAAKAAGR